MRANRFDDLRLLFALFVLITHSYVLAGHGDGDPLQRLTHDQLAFSWIGVRGFFVISGFLVFRSFQRSDNVASFAMKRIRRIMPALIVVVALSTLLLGPVVSSFSLKTYFANADTWRYMAIPISVFVGQVPYSLPGVFADVPHARIVNGSLWTIGYELLCYAFTALLFVVKTRPKAARIVLAALFGIASASRIGVDSGTLSTEGFLPFTLFTWRSLSDLMPFYLAGSVAAAFDLQRYLTGWHAVAGAFCIVLLTLATGYYFLAETILLPTIVLALAHLPGDSWVSRSRVGDISYGTYLYGYPVQQATLLLLTCSPLHLMALAIPLACAFGLGSWFFVERPFLAPERRKGAAASAASTAVR